MRKKNNNKNEHLLINKNIKKKPKKPKKQEKQELFVLNIHLFMPWFLGFHRLLKIIYNLDKRAFRGVFISTLGVE